MKHLGGGLALTLLVLRAHFTIEPQWECVSLCTGVQLEDVLMSVLLQA